MRTNKKRKGNSVWTISGGSTGLVQQKKSSYKSKTLDKNVQLYIDRISKLGKRIPPIIENPDYVNSFSALVDAIKRIKNQEWLGGKWINKSSTNKDKHEARLYRILSGSLKRCMNLNPDFKSTKLYEDALPILSGSLKRCMNLNPDFKSTKLYEDALSIAGAGFTKDEIQMWNGAKVFFKIKMSVLGTDLYFDALKIYLEEVDYDLKTDCDCFGNDLRDGDGKWLADTVKLSLKYLNDDSWAKDVYKNYLERQRVRIDNHIKKDGIHSCSAKSIIDIAWSVGRDLKCNAWEKEIYKYFFRNFSSCEIKQEIKKKVLWEQLLTEIRY